MNIEKRLQALEKSRGSSYVFVDKALDETEEALARYVAEHGEKPQGAMIFMGPLDWEI